MYLVTVLLPGYTVDTALFIPTTYNAETEEDKGVLINYLRRYDYTVRVDYNIWQLAKLSMCASR